MEGLGEEAAADIDSLPLDLLAHVFSLIPCFKDLAQASSVCRKWRQGVEESLAWREQLSFSGWKMDDESTARLVNLCYGLKELDISRSRWGSQITDHGLYLLSKAKCISKLSSVSLWGLTAVTDKGIIEFISCANSLRHLNVGGTFITDASLFVIADSCPHLKSLALWGCRQVTETGLNFVVNKCGKLESINVWGMRIPLNCLVALLKIRPRLQIHPK